MLAFCLSQHAWRLRRTSSFLSENQIHPTNDLEQHTRTNIFVHNCQASLPYCQPSRRAFIAFIAAYVTAPVLQKAQAERLLVEPYNANTSRRYVDQGRPAPDRSIPRFIADIPTFNIDEQFSAQDLKTGNGDPVKKGTLVMARWLAVLEDGTTVDDANEKQAAVFRPGTHQVPPGIEDAVIGMKTGGVRRVSGTSERILSNIAVGNNIGERSLVPTGTTMYIDIFVDRVNPFGTSR